MMELGVPAMFVSVNEVENEAEPAKPLAVAVMA